MIRAFRPGDMDAVVVLWLETSIAAHGFVPPTVWESQCDNMRNTYLPASEVAVYDEGGAIAGFYALVQNTLAALFVAPPYQGRGFGTALLNHAKSRRAQLTLSVYVENEASCRYYLGQGFTVTAEQTDTHTGHQEYTMIYRPG
jgi:putative acetyltransferase